MHKIKLNAINKLHTEVKDIKKRYNSIDNAHVSLRDGTTDVRWLEDVQAMAKNGIKPAKRFIEYVKDDIITQQELKEIDHMLQESRRQQMKHMKPSEESKHLSRALTTGKPLSQQFGSYTLHR